MNIRHIKAELVSAGILDQRQLLSYATLTATIQGQAFQNIVAVCFQGDGLSLYRANLDNTLGPLLVRCPYEAITEFDLHSRFLYSYTAFRCGSDRFRFYSYDKAVFLQGFRDAGLLP